MAGTVTVLEDKLALIGLDGVSPSQLNHMQEAIDWLSAHDETLLGWRFLLIGWSLATLDFRDRPDLEAAAREIAALVAARLEVPA